MRKMQKGVRIEMTREQAKLIADSDVAKRCKQTPGGVMFLQPSFADGDYFFRAIYIEPEAAREIRDVLRKTQGVK